MVKHLRMILPAALLLAVSAARAGYNVQVNALPALREAPPTKVVIVTALCHEMVNCADVEDRLLVIARTSKTGWPVIGGPPVRNSLLEAGIETYSTDRRVDVAEKLGVDALLEVEVPHGEGRKLGVSGSQVKVKIRIVRPGGAILMTAEGTGRVVNTVQSPESVAGGVLERIFKKAFK